MPIYIKNWSQFQHFKDRRPPWIKLHRDILDQRDINVLSDGSFRVLIGLWLLASEDSEMEGALPSVEDMAFRLRTTIPNINKALKELGHFLYQDDITTISDGYHVDDPETETETETERDKKRFTAPSVSDVQSFCLEHKLTGVDADAFVDFYTSKGWKIGNNPMKDWHAAARNWHRREKAANGKTKQESPY